MDHLLSKEKEKTRRELILFGSQRKTLEIVL